jgi:hypothetical protein
MARTKHTDKKRKIEEVSEEEVSGEEEEQNSAPKNACEKCNKNTLFSVCSKGCDNNRWTFPNGEEGEGYLPVHWLPGFGDTDGLNITICCDCGALQGLNLADLRQKVLYAQDDK